MTDRAESAEDYVKRVAVEQYLALASPADVARLAELGTIPCVDAHREQPRNVLGEKIHEEHTLAECNGVPMVERLGASLPPVNLYAKCKRRGHHLPDEDTGHCVTCNLAPGIGNPDLWPEEEAEAMPEHPVAFVVVACACGANWRKPAGKELCCVNCGVASSA